MANLIPIFLLVIILSSKFQMEKYNCFNKESFDACLLVLMVENQMVNLISIILLGINFSSKFQMEITISILIFLIEDLSNGLLGPNLDLNFFFKKIPSNLFSKVHKP